MVGSVRFHGLIVMPYSPGQVDGDSDTAQPTADAQPKGPASDRSGVGPPSVSDPALHPGRLGTQRYHRLKHVLRERMLQPWRSGDQVPTSSTPRSQVISRIHELSPILVSSDSCRMSGCPVHWPMITS